MQKLQITEVGPRDGLQNLSQPASLETRIWLVERLAKLGLPRIETGSFVNPRAVPGMKESDEVFERISRRQETCYMALVPNLRGAQDALSCNADRLALFTAASETFCQRNTGCSSEQSLQRFAPVFQLAGNRQVPVRAYISCVSGCPYEGKVAIAHVADLAARLLDMGADEICLADTTGVGNPLHTSELVSAVSQQVPVEQIALHMHDTYGMGLINSWAGYQLGVRRFDSSIAGLGGCPFAPGSAGNLATEDLVYFLQSIGIDTGVDLQALVELGRTCCTRLGIENRSRVSNALTAGLVTHAAG